MYTLRCKIFNINPETLATKDIQSFSHKMEPITLSTTITRTTKYSIPIHHKDVKLYDTPSYYIHLGFHFIRAKKKKTNICVCVSCNFVILSSNGYTKLCNSNFPQFQELLFFRMKFSFGFVPSPETFGTTKYKSKNIFLFV